jgi:PAS domain S-box-containing protein
VRSIEPSEDVLQGLLAAAPEALVAIDPAGTIVYANEQACRLFGWERDELIGLDVEMLVPERLNPRHASARVELSARRQDGSEFPAEISLSTVESPSGTILLAAAIRDVSERIGLAAERQRHALEAQREQSQRLESLGQLAGGVAHDFNNLLGVILNYSTLLIRQLAADPTAAADLEEIRAAAERGASLTRQLLAFARRDVAHPEFVDVTDAIRGLASMLKLTLGEHIALVLDLAPEPLVALADRHQLEQVLLNLAINARDAMPDGGTLTIAAIGAADGDGAPITVRVVDTGHGMPADTLARAFEPFFTTKTRGRGSGLGLASVYGIVQQAGGDVSIESQVGVGTVVTVCLPRGAGGTDDEGSVTGAAAGGAERVLLVEDEAALRVGTARLLVENGYLVTVASDGAEALELVGADAAAFDVVITDVAMPRMRGDQFARILAERHPDLTVIFMSGYDSGSTSLPGRLLTKPFDEATLLLTMREALDG